MKSKNNKIIVFANQKGGVGKSTLCILLADYLAYWKKDVCIIDTDLQQSATLQREQDKQTFGEEEPYNIQSFEVSDPKTMQMLMENAESQDGFVLFDAPGTIKDDGLAPMFIYADYIICPFEYESKSLSSTLTFIQVINRLRQLNSHTPSTRELTRRTREVFSAESKTYQCLIHISLHGPFFHMHSSECKSCFFL